MKVTILNLSEYENFYNENLIEIVQSPFQTFKVIKLLFDYFKDDFYFITYMEKDIFLMGICLFKKETKAGSHLYSFGRFGVSGLILGNIQEIELIDLLELFFQKDIYKITSNPISASIGYLQINYNDQQNSVNINNISEALKLKLFQRINLCVDLKRITKNGKISIIENKNINGKYRRNITRNLRIAKENQIIVSKEFNKKILNEWYSIHEQRIKELDGNKWDYGFFENLLDSEIQDHSQFFGAYFEEKLIGGVVCFFCNNVLDVFMLSTVKKNQMLGVNHLLAYEIYKWSINNGIKYVNWQASNPPNGGVAKFKKQFFAEDVYFYSVNKFYINNVFKINDFRNLMKNNQDRFFYPLG